MHGVPKEVYASIMKSRVVGERRTAVRMVEADKKLHLHMYRGAKGDCDLRISYLVKKNRMGLIFNPCGEFRLSPEGPFSQIHFPHLHPGAPGIFPDLLRSVEMLKREWGAESNEKLPHLFIPSKTATLVLEFPVKDLPLGRTL